MDALELRQREERRIVRKMIRKLAAEGWTLDAVNDGEEILTGLTLTQAMRYIFDVDLSYVYFKGPAGQRHYVMLVCGNGEDIISDYSFTQNDDVFSKVMDSLL